MRLFFDTGIIPLSPEEYAERKRQRQEPLRECVKCHQLTTKFPPERNVCLECRRKQKLASHTHHPRRKK